MIRPSTGAGSAAERSGVGNVKGFPALGSTAQKTLALPERLYSLARLATLSGSQIVNPLIRPLPPLEFNNRQLRRRRSRCLSKRVFLGMGC
jgi:hypothetical protein